MRRPFFTTLAASVLTVSVAMALPQAGTSLSDFTVQDSSDNNYTLSGLRANKPALIVYEDKDAGSQNQGFKEKFGTMQKANGNRVTLIPIADVAAYNYFPAKLFVKEALDKASKKNGVTVFADWTGKPKTILGAQSGQSNLFLLDAAGKVLWASAGQLTKTQEESLLEMIKPL